MLRKLFIKNYKDTQNSQVRLKYGVVSSCYGIITNLILFVAKILVGFMSGSVAIISDALNNLSDGIASGVALVGFKLSNKPADSEHPFGHARYEYISAFIISFLICMIGVVLGKTSIDKIINPKQTEVGLLVIIVLSVSILIKLSQYLLYRQFAKAIDSDSIKANSVDARNDTIVTTATLIAMIIIWTCGVNIDAYMGLAVSIVIVISGIRMLIDTINPLLGEKPDKELVDKIKNKLRSYDGVLGFHELMIHAYGKNKNYVTVHVEVSAEVDPLKTHDLIDDIEEDFLNDLGLHIVVHSDPVQHNNRRVTTLKNQVQKTLEKLNAQLVIHDFRVADGKLTTEIMFDCIVPYEVKLTKKEIVSYLKQNFNKNKRYRFSIDIDRNYV